MKKTMQGCGAGVIGMMALVVAGCAGGYTQEMRLRPEGVTWPAVSKTVVEVRITGREDVAAVVGKAGEELGMKPDARSTMRWWVKQGKDGEGSFSISLGREKSGTWSVQLTDWPGVARSELSMRAEERIRAGLGSGG